MWNLGWSAPAPTPPQLAVPPGQFCGSDPPYQQSQAQVQAQITALQQQNALLNQQLHNQSQTHINHLQQLLPHHQAQQQPTTTPPSVQAPAATQPLSHPATIHSVTQSLSHSATQLCFNRQFASSKHAVRQQGVCVNHLNRCKTSTRLVAGGRWGTLQSAANEDAAMFLCKRTCFVIIYIYSPAPGRI